MKQTICLGFCKSAILHNSKTNMAPNRDRNQEHLHHSLMPPDDLRFLKYRGSTPMEVMFPPRTHLKEVRKAGRGKTLENLYNGLSCAATIWGLLISATKCRVNPNLNMMCEIRAQGSSSRQWPGGPAAAAMLGP